MRLATALPMARSVLSVVARPGDESWYLGAILDAFHAQGSRLSVLSFTRGERSGFNDSLHRLESIRLWEFEAAAFALGADHCTMADYPDKGLSRFPIEQLTEHVTREIRERKVDLLLTIDGRLTERIAPHAAVRAGRECGIPVLAWTLPHGVAQAVRRVAGLAVTGDPYHRIDLEVPVRRQRQWQATGEHHSQAAGDSVQRARLAVQGDREWLRWLVPPDIRTMPAPCAPTSPEVPS
jgi:LmbE family N-acetylglucosaminyl deacetylase